MIYGWSDRQYLGRCPPQSGSKYVDLRRKVGMRLDIGCACQRAAQMNTATDDEVVKAGGKEDALLLIPKPTHQNGTHLIVLCILLEVESFQEAA